MNDIKRYKALTEITRLVNNMEKALKNLIIAGKAYDTKKQKMVA
jgi:hypothetical protein